MPNETTLTTAETQELEALEAVVNNGMRSFVEVGTALLAIRDKRLWRGVSETFEGFCQVRWGFSRRRADQLIDAASIVTAFGNGDEKVVETNENPGSKNGVPATERQARALAKVPPEKRKEVF